MKIAFFLPEFADGGVERTSIIKAKRMVELGYGVDIVSYNVGSGFDGKNIDNVRFIDLGVPRTIASLPGLVKYIKQYTPDVIISAHYFANIIAVIAKIISRKSKVRLILTERTALLTLMHVEPHHISKKHLFAMRLTYRFADAVVANSQASAIELSKILHWSQEDVKVIYNPTYDKSILTQACEPVDCSWLNQRDCPVLVAVGRLVYQKDFENLLRAFTRVLSIRQCRLIILGKGPQKQFLEQLTQKLGIQEHVLFAGFTRNPYKYIARANAFVLSSRYEGLPNVLIEAQALGVPIISTDCPTGPREILLDGCAGKLVPVADPYALAEAILQILEDDQLSVKFVQEGYQYLNRFSPDVCVNKYLSIIEKVA